MTKKNQSNRPHLVIDRERIDTAKQLLGRVVHPSRVAERLAKKYKCSPSAAYRLIEAARIDVIESFKDDGSGRDPLTIVYLSLEDILADPRSTRQDRVGAAGVMVRLLGMDRYLQRLDALVVEDFLAGLVKKQAARLSEPRPGQAKRAESTPAPDADCEGGEE